MIVAGRAMAAPAAITPPFDCMIRSGARQPARRSRPASEAR